MGHVQLSEWYAAQNDISSPNGCRPELDIPFGNGMSPRMIFLNGFEWDAEIIAQILNTYGNPIELRPSSLKTKGNPIRSRPNPKNTGKTLPWSPQEASGGLWGPQEASGGLRRLQEAPGGRRPQEAPGGPLMVDSRILRNNSKDGMYSSRWN